jgi:hypothetical protein
LVYQDSTYSLVHLVVAPLATAAFYILAFPYPSNWVYSYSLRRRKEALSLKREIDDQTVLTQEESRSLRNRFTEIEVEHTKESVRLSGEIDRLKDQLKKLIEERDAIAKELSDARAGRERSIDESSSTAGASRRVHLADKTLELDKHQWMLLDVLGRYGGNNTYLSALSERMGLGEAAIWLLAGGLEDMKLVKRDTVESKDGRRTRMVSLTPMGLSVFMASLSRE